MVGIVTVDVRNESGDNWCAFEKDRSGSKVYVTDNDGNLICGDAMVMPDGTKLNGGKGFTYRDVSMGFYMDADVVSTDIFGNFGVCDHLHNISLHPPPAGTRPTIVSTNPTTILVCEATKLL